MSDLQPYYVAYLKTTTNPSNQAYMVWIRGKHKQFRAIHGLQEHNTYNDKQREEFLKFIGYDTNLIV